MYPCEFIADEGKTSGVACYMVDGLEFIVALNSFADCQTIGKMLVLAEKQGRGVAEAHVLYALEAMANKLRMKP